MFRVLLILSETQPFTYFLVETLYFFQVKEAGNGHGHLDLCPVCVLSPGLFLAYALVRRYSRPVWLEVGPSRCLTNSSTCKGPFTPDTRAARVWSEGPPLCCEAERPRWVCLPGHASVTVDLLICVTRCSGSESRRLRIDALTLFRGDTHYLLLPTPGSVPGARTDGHHIHCSPSGVGKSHGGGVHLIFMETLPTCWWPPTYWRLTQQLTTGDLSIGELSIGQLTRAPLTTG